MTDYFGSWGSNDAHTLNEPRRQQRQPQPQQSQQQHQQQPRPLPRLSPADEQSSDWQNGNRIKRRRHSSPISSASSPASSSTQPFSPPKLVLKTSDQRAKKSPIRPTDLNLDYHDLSVLKTPLRKHITHQQLTPTSDDASFRDDNTDSGLLSDGDDQIECVARNYGDDSTLSTSRLSIVPQSFVSTTDDQSSTIPQSHSSLSSLSIYQEQLDPLPEGVPSGLINLGNTCYMNAALQALYSIDLFRTLLICNRRRIESSRSLTSELSELFNVMKESSNHRSASTSAAISPANFKHAFSRHQSKFSGLGQQDAQEFLRYLINGVHEESNQANKRPRRRSPISGEGGQQQCAPTNSAEAWSRYRAIVDDSPFVDILVGQLCSTITCSQCQNESHCWDPFWDLSLPLASAHTHNRYGECNLLDLLDEFTAKETLDSDERPICERCKKATKSTKQISLARLPQVLILHLKKFTNDGYKLSCPNVRIETKLRFDDRQVVYHLKACISHHGHSSSSGHYTSHCEYSNRWFNFDDDR